MSKDTNKDNEPSSYTLYEEWVYEVFAAARDGNVSNLNNLLENKSVKEINDALNRFTDEEGFRATPLIMAARNGHSGTVKELIERYRVYKEQAGTIKSKHEYVEGATAVWSAAAFNHVDTVKVLLDLGADINTVCPLRPAVYEGNIDMVRCLVERGAMVNVPSRFYNNTCLMLAASRNTDQETVDFLLDHGADINFKDRYGRTVLHYAAENGVFSILQVLLDKGALHVKDNARMTPIQLACMNQNEVAVKFMIDQLELTTVEEIEAIELLGASFQESQESFDSVYSYLHRALEMRHQNKPEVIKKKDTITCVEYDHRKEVETLDEIKAIEENPLELNFQSLLVKERILGEDHEFVQDSIIYVAGVLADNKKWAKSLELITRAISLKLSNHYRINDILLLLCKLLVVMVDSNAPPYSSQVLTFIENCIQEINAEKARYQKAPLPSERMECLNGIQQTTFAFLQLLAVIYKLDRTSNTDNEVYRLTRIFNDFDIRLSMMGNMTPLHVVCSEEFEIDSCLFDEVVYTPHTGILKFMFMNGFKADVTDKKGNTPLHLVFANEQATNDKKMLKEVVDMFLQAGARLDVKNIDDKTPLDLTNDKIIKYLKSEFRKTRYKSMFI